MQIKWSETIHLEDDMHGVGPGTRAYVVTEGEVIHPGITKYFPGKSMASITALTSRSDDTVRHTYEISIYGVAIEKVLELAKAFADERFEDAERLIAELNPPYARGGYSGFGRMSDFPLD